MLKIYVSFFINYKFCSIIIVIYKAGVKMIPNKNLDCTIEYFETESEKYYSVSVRFLNKTRDYLSFSIDPDDKSVSFEEWTDEKKTYTKSEMVGYAKIYLDKMDDTVKPKISNDLADIGKFIFTAK